MPPNPIRIAPVIDGHVHPSFCKTHSIDLLAVYNKEGGGGKELLLCRSTDAGHTWTTPAPITTISSISVKAEIAARPRLSRRGFITGRCCW